MDIINSDPSCHSALPRPPVHGSYSRRDELALVRNWKTTIKKKERGLEINVEPVGLSTDRGHGPLRFTQICYLESFALDFPPNVP